MDDSHRMNGMVKAAVIGVGAMGRHHARVYKELPGADLVGVVDIDPAQAKQIGDQHGTRAYTDYGVMFAEEQHLEFQRIKTVDDLDREIASAASQGKTAMLDFYADWCVSCIEMEEYTFTQANVHDALANTVLLQADVTANDEQDQELLQRFGVFGPPTIIFFNNNGEQVHGYEVVGFMQAGDFASHVQKALQ